MFWAQSGKFENGQFTFWIFIYYAGWIWRLCILPNPLFLNHLPQLCVPRSQTHLSLVVWVWVKVVSAALIQHFGDGLRIHLWKTKFAKEIWLLDEGGTYNEYSLSWIRCWFSLSLSLHPVWICSVDNILVAWLWLFQCIYKVVPPDTHAWQKYAKPQTQKHGVFKFHFTSLFQIEDFLVNLWLYDQVLKQLIWIFFMKYYRLFHL